jgi:hypothetical protein
MAKIPIGTWWQLIAPPSPILLRAHPTENGALLIADGTVIGRIDTLETAEWLVSLRAALPAAISASQSLYVQRALLHTALRTASPLTAAQWAQALDIPQDGTSDVDTGVGDAVEFLLGLWDLD